VLIGAALNAAFDQIWPQRELTTARLERLKRLKLENVLPWRNSLEAVVEEKDRSARANDPAENDPAEQDATPSGTASNTSPT
jgi:membrane protein